MDRGEGTDGQAGRRTERWKTRRCTDGQRRRDRRTGGQTDREMEDETGHRRSEETGQTDRQADGRSDGRRVGAQMVGTLSSQRHIGEGGESCQVRRVIYPLYEKVCGPGNN